MADRQPTFMFYSGSLDCPPGLGQCEYIHPMDHAKYADLAQIPNWRQKLSNFYRSPFELDGHTWNSVEHYFHANKTSNGDDYFQFTSEGQLGNQYGATIKRAGRNIIMTKEALIAWDNGKSKEVLFKAQTAKFEQNEEPMCALLLTSGALLTHRASPRSRIVVEHDLMRLRDEW